MSDLTAKPAATTPPPTDAVPPQDAVITDTAAKVINPRQRAPGKPGRGQNRKLPPFWSRWARSIFVVDLRRRNGPRPR